MEKKKSSLNFNSAVFATGRGPEQTGKEGTAQGDRQLNHIIHDRQRRKAMAFTEE